MSLLDIEVDDRSEIEGKTVAHDPGPVDLQITTPFGTVTKTDGYLYTPALTLDGVPVIGQSITIEIWGQVGQTYLLFFSLGTLCVPLPPFGKFQLDPTQAFTLLLSKLMILGFDTVTGTIPNDPGLSGLTFHLQALIGHDIPNQDAYFSNLLSITIL